MDTRPWVRALLRASGTDPVRVTTRPAAQLDDRLPPHPREPLALALRQGQGLGMLVGLPGSELVLEHQWCPGRPCCAGCVTSTCTDIPATEGCLAGSGVLH